MNDLLAQSRTRASLALAVLLLACGPGSGAPDAPDDGGPCAPRVPVPDSACRADTDCPSMPLPSSCLAPGELQRCGMACPTPSRPCEADADCPGEICVAFFQNSCDEACGAEFTRCEPRCTASSCEAGFACGGDGHCAPIPCGTGFTCPSFTTCGAAGGDEHGCVRMPCSADATCGCGGACVEGLCYDSVGTCSFSAA